MIGHKDAPVTPNEHSPMAIQVPCRVKEMSEGKACAVESLNGSYLSNSTTNETKWS